MDIVYQILITIVLVWLSIQDYKTMQLHLSGILLLAGINVWFAITTRQFVPHLIGATIACATLWLLAYISKQQLGWGDVCIITILFLGIGAQSAMGVLLISAVGVVAWTCLLYISTGKWRKAINQGNVPFLPFITFSYVAIMCFG